ncbi:caspase family protein [Phragmitibacter flavus]|nr:caspase family protein [Phragmitibacter flavus]
MNYKVGDSVPELGVKVAEILLSARDVCIFIDDRGDLQWLFDKQPSNSAWIYPRVVELEARCKFFPNASILPPRFIRWISAFTETPSMDHLRSAKRFIGQAIVILYTGGLRAEVEAAFASAEAFIVQRGREISLVWLYASFGLLALISFITLLCLILSLHETQTHIVQKVLTCAFAGGIGAYISRALASRSELPCDANAGKLLHFQEAILRWSVGVVAGGLLCLLIEGKILLGSLGADATGFPAILALATLAGMSERFLPTLLNRFNDRVADLGGAKPPPPDHATKKAALNNATNEFRKFEDETRDAADLAPAPISAPNTIVRQGGARRALCIGIDEYPQQQDRLNGCVNDTKRWERFFKDVGFKTERLLNAEATRDAILKSFRALVSSAKPGDIIAVQYAGHGTQVKDLDGDEGKAGGPNEEWDGIDEALCCHEFRTGSIVLDDDLKEIAITIAPGANLTFFFDSCHSGSATRASLTGPHVPAVPPGAKPRNIIADGNLNAAHAAFYKSLPKELRAQRNAKHRGGNDPYKDAVDILFAAALPKQFAYEISGGGVFTETAMQVLAQSGEFTNDGFMNAVRQAFPHSFSNAQEPKLYASLDQKLNPFLGGLG